MEVGNLAHSHSQPGEMDRTPPGTPKKGAKMLAVRVQMLDDTVTMFQVQAKALGRVLFDQVCNQLNLLESDYFGLEYQEAGGTKYWLDLEKPICRQIGLSLVDTLVRFCVKFYTPDPSQLEEEFTRYLFCLQIKRDLSQGSLQCNSNTAALMASYIVQAECGDYVVEDYPDHRYLSSYKFVPNQDQELERRIMENHKKHAGQSPAEADLNLLETARRCELYGIKMHPAKDHEGCPLNLAVAHMGIVVFQNFSKINTFSWAKIRKISFKRKRFLVKLHPEGYGYYKDTVEFFFEGRNECKNFWKKCVENHGFFRCSMVKKVPRQKTRVLSRGSSFRYSGRTQKQIVDFVRENYVKRQTFQRSQSFRHSSSAHSSVANVGTSISAHPLLPLGDNAVAGTPASLSCGSMTLTSSPVHTADIHAGGSPSPPLTTSVSPGTSVTSSPQHFYPQETPYRRAGLRPTKAKRPPVRSHHAISLLLSPTADAATDVGNRSANHSNNAIVDSSDIISSRNSLKSPEFIDFNDVYSNCYTSLRSLGKAIDDKIVGEGGKSEIYDLTFDFVNESTKSIESIGPMSKKSKTLFSESQEDIQRYTWHRSASCEQLFRDGNVAPSDEKDGKMTKEGESFCERGTISPGTRYEKSKRKCYSAVTSKNPSIDRTGEPGTEMRIYSSSYPGTTSSASTESAEGELEDRIVELLDVKCESPEDVALSHDDVSHDSYELLERELEDYNEDPSRSQRGRLNGESERTRSCSWGSDKGVTPFDFRSAEKMIGSGFDISREQSCFWSLEREKSAKHKSEMDFRTFSSKDPKSSRQTTKNFEIKSHVSVERKIRATEFLDHDNRFGKRSRELNENVMEAAIRNNQLDGRIYRSKNFGTKDPVRGLGQDLKLRGPCREENENLEAFEKQREENRRKSLEETLLMESKELNKELAMVMEEKRRIEKRREKKEREERFHEGLKEKEQKEWEREKERRQMDRRRSTEEKELRGEEELVRKRITKPSDYANFQEIHFKKFDRVVSNQFGRYSEFLTQESTYDFLAQEKKVIDNYEKMCQVSRMAKELKKSESKNAVVEKMVESKSREMMESNEWKNALTDRSSPKVARAIVERTKSDPYYLMKNQKRNILTHQKSIDLTPQHSEDTTSDFDNEDIMKKVSRSEHDIPYVLHKRHCMNGTARNPDGIFVATDLKSALGYTAAAELSEIDSPIGGLNINKLVEENVVKNLNFDEMTMPKQKQSCAKLAEAKKAGVQIINLDLKNFKSAPNFSECKKAGKSPKPPTPKKPGTTDLRAGSPKVFVKKEVKKGERFEPLGTFGKAKDSGNDETQSKGKKKEEPIYAEVCREGDVDDKNSLATQEKVPPQPPKRTSSYSHKVSPEESPQKSEWKAGDIGGDENSASKTPTKRATIGEADGPKFPEPETKNGKVKPEGGFPGGVYQRREESLTLFARTRLGLSEGSAFVPIVRQGRVGSPGFQRRAKSLDAPYVSVHRLPPADAFSSKDDTVDGDEGDLVDSAVARFEELKKGDARKIRGVVAREGHSVSEPAGNTESEADSVFTDDLDAEGNFKKTVASLSKVELPFSDEKVLDGVRGKRLLSKIESVDFIDSEGDLDSSRLAGPPSIPSDRLVNLPESIRFPSVRQISGQTSEESADGWDQKEVKVKRRTPRRSLGREEQDTHAESVVWDSRDDEPPEDEVWGDDAVPGIVVNAGVSGEYLKRGSCGQSIDDDNLSTPMKESSPEHWVSVDDLPEALEREEKLLRQQEKILREKILNEKLKRELNLDTIDVDERYYDFKENLKLARYEEEMGNLKENLKGHSLDTYELNEKKFRERRGNKNSNSLDEDLLPNKLIGSHLGLEPKEKIGSKTSNYGAGLDYVQCKVVKDVSEIDQFGDNDDELEEFFVVLDENLEKEERDMVWEEDDDSFGRKLSDDGILHSVMEELKAEENEASKIRSIAEKESKGKVEIRLSEVRGREEEGLGVVRSCESAASEGGSAETSGKEAAVRAAGAGGDMGRLSPFGGSRRGSEDNRKSSVSEEREEGRLSPYESFSPRSFEDLRRLSASEVAGRLSPFSDSRRGSEDPRRLSTSEDSRKCSVSESVSEETRRRLSSTEETRRKRASLTKQCSVGVDSLSDDVISGIQECSSSFEHDDKDVFEPESAHPKLDEESNFSAASEMKKTNKYSEGDVPRMKLLEIEVSEESSSEIRAAAETGERLTKEEQEMNLATHLAPPTGERELSRETEDSVDYGEGDFKDIREAVKEKDISEDLAYENDSLKFCAQKRGSSVDKSESSEEHELHYIDEKRGSTPEITVGKSREAVAMSIVIVNEGISVLNKINEKDRKLGEAAENYRSLGKTAGFAFAKKGDIRHWESAKPPKPFDVSPKTLPEIKVKTVSCSAVKEPTNLLKSSLDSSQDSDLDRLSDLSLVSHVQNQIARRNLSDAGRCLRRDEFRGVASAESSSRKTSSEDDVLLGSQKTSSEEREKTESSSFEQRSSADESGVGEEAKWKEAKGRAKLGAEAGKAREGRRDGSCGPAREKRSPEQEKRDSGEDGSSSSSAPLCPKRELSSTWKPFLLESSGSSSLEEGWLPPDENAHLADEEETSSTSNNQQDDSCHDDADYPTGIGYPVLNMTSAEMIVSGYGSVYALSRTLSRISERSTSEQERSDVEDDVTKPSSRSMSVEEESIMSSDRQPSLSSDPPSPKEGGSFIPDLPVDKLPAQCSATAEERAVAFEPFGDVIPPPVPEEDWPSPPSSSSVVDTPVVSHIETFYLEIHPEEACKVVVAEPRDEGNSSSDENQTLQEESEFLHLSSDNVSASTTTTTQDGTVVIPVRPKSGRTSSFSEDASMISVSERSVPGPTKPRPSAGEDVPERTKAAGHGETSDWSTSSKYRPENHFEVPPKIKPLKPSSPTGKTFGFFETPVSKVRSPTSQMKFFESVERGASGGPCPRSPTSLSESTSPKRRGAFFDGPPSRGPTKGGQAIRSPTKAASPRRSVADSAEKSYFGRYDTGSLERTKIQSSRKCSSYYFVSRVAPGEGDGAGGDAPPAPSPNTIPRASKKTKRRHRVAMDLLVRDGKIVAPPKTETTVLDNSDSDRSSPSRRNRSQV